LELQLLIKKELKKLLLGLQVCLGFQAKIVRIEGKKAIVSDGKTGREAIIVIDGLKENDRVLVQQGIVVEKL
jgi:hypothetical protein